MSFASHILHTQQGIRGLRHANPPYRNGGSRLSATQHPPGVHQELVGVTGSAVGQSRELTSEPLHGGLRLIASLG